MRFGLVKASVSIVVLYTTMALTAASLTLQEQAMSDIKQAGVNYLRNRGNTQSKGNLGIAIYQAYQDMEQKDADKILQNISRRLATTLSQLNQLDTFLSQYLPNIKHATPSLDILEPKDLVEAEELLTNAARSLIENTSKATKNCLDCAICTAFEHDVTEAKIIKVAHDVILSLSIVKQLDTIASRG
ncbi:hypothetical protein KAU11_05935 [Candidatus Babeliales bacterium]|nr:hypothetical protein [Candidatus Babeliales bacterium]